ncbi:MAG: galactose mutarotase [Sedimentisphaerales bacterium]|nr:galactose mutarotase [Sedimentisphaerales bacterium]
MKRAEKVTKLFKSNLALVLVAAICLGTLMGCAGGLQKGASITKDSFGQMPDGTDVDIYTLVNKNGNEVRITNYGGIIVSLKVPDKDGNLGDVMLGRDSVEDYIENNSPYFGALIGRYGNRIGKGTFELDGKTYTLAKNNGENHLHGGNVGFDKVLWDAKKIVVKGCPGLELTYFSKDGEEGYPGNLTVTVKYIWTNKNELKIEYTANTDKPTVVNLTSHGYFNLSGKGDILGHELMINAEKMTPVDSGLIPTGEVKEVAGTPFDFRALKTIGKDIAADDQQIEYGPGYDHNFVLDKAFGEMSLAAEVYDPSTGRDMEVWTTEPSLQFYSGNFLDGTITGKYGQVYNKHAALCLESQHNPDSPNQPGWPTTTLRPKQTYRTTTIYKFSTK